MMDMHCHIDLYLNPEEVIQRCLEEGIYVLSVTTTPKAWDVTYALTKKIPRFNTALGLHPQLAHEREHELVLFDKLIDQTRYIGEIGLDGSQEYKPYFQNQLRVFRHILRKCQNSPDKILTVHSRQAVKQVVDELENHRGAGTTILHWYLGTMKEMKRALDMGCWFSIGPPMITSIQGKKVINWLPKERVLLETDGPFTSHNGKKLEPIDTKIVIDYLSNIWQVTTSQVQDILNKNLEELLKI